MELLPNDMGRAAPRLQWDAVATTGSLEQCTDTVVPLEESERALKQGKKLTLQGFFLLALEEEFAQKEDRSGSSSSCSYSN